MTKKGKKNSPARLFIIEKETALKLAAILLVGIIWVSVRSVQNTNAYFSDKESSNGNKLFASILDFNITPSTFDPIGASLNLSTGTTTSKTIDFVLTPTSIPVTYFASTTDMTGDVSFCRQIRVDALLDGNPFGSDSLTNFKSATTTGNATTTINAWKFNFTMPSAPSMPNSICSFNFAYNGRQADPYSGTGGFSDIETATNTIASWGFRINKVYYDVDAAHGVKGDNEWVEIYNQTDAALDISGWQICDNSSCNTIPGSALIPAKGSAVITDAATTWQYWDIPSDVVKIVLGATIGDGLGNDGDRLILKRPDGVVIDEMNWQNDTGVWDPGSVDVAKGDMLGRVPTGYDTDQPSDFVELKPPTVAMVNPVGGEVWYVGDAYDVQWTAHSNNLGSADNMLKISLWYSADSGNTWAEFASGLDNTGSYHWVVPLFIDGYYVPSHISRIKAVAVGPENFMVQAQGSSQDFCPPIDYDALSPADQQLVDQMVAKGLIDPSEVIKGRAAIEGSATTTEMVGGTVTSAPTDGVQATTTDSLSGTTTPQTIDGTATSTPEMVPPEAGTTTPASGSMQAPVEPAAELTPAPEPAIIPEPAPASAPAPVPEPAPATAPDPATI